MPKPQLITKLFGKKHPKETHRKSPFGIKKQLLAVPIILSIVLVASAGMVLAQQPQLQISEDGILTSDYGLSSSDDNTSVFFLPGTQFDPVPFNIVAELTSPANPDFVYSVFVGDRSVAFTTDNIFDVSIFETGTNTVPKYYESDPAILVDIPKCTVDDTVTCYDSYPLNGGTIGISTTQSGNYVLVSDGTPEPIPEPDPTPDSPTVTDITATGTENTTITQTITVTNVPPGYTYTSIAADSALTTAGVSISGTESNGTITISIDLPSAQASAIIGNIVVSYGDGTTTLTSNSAVSLTVNPASEEAPEIQNETPAVVNSCIPGLPDDGLKFNANVNSPGNLVQRYLDLDPDCTYVRSSIDADLVNDGFVDDTRMQGSQLIAGFYHPTVLNGTTTFSGTYTVIFDKDGSTSEDIDISFTVIAPIIEALPEPVIVPPTDPETTTEGVSVDASSRLILVVSHTDENTSSQDAVATQYAVTVPPGYTLEDVTVDAGLGEAGVFASIVTESTRTDSDGNPVIDTVTDSNGNPIIEFKSSPREFDRTARGTVLLDYVNTSTNEGVTYALPTTGHIIGGISDPALPNLVISASGGDATDPLLPGCINGSDEADQCPTSGGLACTNSVNAIVVCDDDNPLHTPILVPNRDACDLADANCELADPDPKYLCDESDIYAPEPIDDVIREEEIIRECDTINLGDDTREGDHIARQPKLVVIEGLADYTCNEATRLAGLLDAHVQVAYSGTNTDGNHLVEFTAPYRVFPDVIEGVVKLNCSTDNAVISSFTLPVTININPTYDVLPFQGTLDPISSGGSDDTAPVSPFPPRPPGAALVPGVTCQVPTSPTTSNPNPVTYEGTGPLCLGVPCIDTRTYSNGTEYCFNLN